MKRVALIAVVLAGGCEKTDTLYCQMHPQDHANCGGTTDAHGIDTLVYMDAPAAPVCVGAAGAYQVCVPTPSSPKTLATGTVVDTTPGVQGSPCLPTQPDGWINAGQPASCFIVGTDVTIQDITVTGPRPLVVVATGSINVTGSIDAASHATVTGPGSPFSACVAGTTPGTSNQGGAGGAGGSFTSKGGNGGDGDGGNSTGSSAAALVAAPTKLRAGCTGGGGADGGAANTGGKGGAGGGAVALLAMTNISLSGTSIINVSGAGAAAAAAPRGGGAGGGSGGMIVLRAASITGTGAKLVANGGGGSSGTNNNAGGAAGNDPIATTPDVPAVMVAGPGGGGTGQSGFSGAGFAVAGGTGAGGTGGGGGGGGGGYIEASVAIGGSITSPPVTVVP